jgi:hypothetical protein
MLTGQYRFTKTSIMLKKYFSLPLLALSFFYLATLAPVSTTAQTAITAVSSNSNTAVASQTYTIGTNTYNWGVAPNNNTVLVDGFTAGGVPYTYASFLTGSVKLRRVNNANVSGNFTLIWAESTTNGTIFNMLPSYEGDMEPFFNNRVYNKGTDNFFDNTSGNNNNIERLDWIVSAGFNVGASPGNLGFAIFERGAAAAHDPFCIAAITSLDAMGNPATYGNIVRVATASYGDPGPSVNYRILKAAQPGNLAEAGTGTQTRGGVIISLQNLGIAANTTVYGYSLFANDLPVGATPANLVDFTNATYFPTNTGNPGGIDLIAVTGLYIATALLPVRFTQLSGMEKNGFAQLTWQVESSGQPSQYMVERMVNGTFVSVGQIAGTVGNGSEQLAFTDRSATLQGNTQYRIAQSGADGSRSYSPVITVTAKTPAFAVKAYPTPVQQQLGLQVSIGKPGAGQWTLVDMTGRSLMQQTVSLMAGSQVLPIDMGQLPTGRYMLLLRVGSEYQYLPITKL